MSITQPLQPDFDFEELSQIRPKGDCPADQCSITQQGLLSMTPKGLVLPITQASSHYTLLHSSYTRGIFTLHHITPSHLCSYASLGTWPHSLASSKVPEVASSDINPAYNTKFTSNILL